MFFRLQDRVSFLNIIFNVTFFASKFYYLIRAEREEREKERVREGEWGPVS
jgi:hypothetical protein